MSERMATLLAVVSETMARELNRSLTEEEQVKLGREEAIQVICGGVPVGMSVIERMVRRDDRVFHLSVPPKKVTRMRILLPRDSTPPCIKKSCALVKQAYDEMSKRCAEDRPPVDISVSIDKGAATPEFVFKLPPS